MEKNRHTLQSRKVVAGSKLNFERKKRVIQFVVCRKNDILFFSTAGKLAEVEVRINGITFGTIQRENLLHLPAV